MNILLITDGFETNKPKHIEEAVKSLFNKLNTTFPKSKLNSTKALISEEGLAIVLTKLHLVHNSKNHKIKLIDILADPNFLYYAWCIIMEGKTLSGIDEVPIQNVGVRTLRNLSAELYSGNYKPKPANRIYIKKANGQERPIGIPTSRDKIVQQALKTIIEPLFESHFSTYSHGFRSGRSCHTALHQIQKNWGMVSYFINLDLNKLFDKLGHKQIISALKKCCKDRDILTIIYLMLKSGYVNLTNSRGLNLNAQEGTPQGSIISPLLSNILLNEFDWVVENKIIPKYNKKAPHTYRSKEYCNATQAFSDKDYQSRSIVVSDKDSFAQKKGIDYALKDESTERLWYVRYADDLLFGYVGPKTIAYTLTSEIIHELTAIGIDVTDTSHIAHHSKGTRFLSYNIHGNYTKTKGGKKRARTTVSFSAPISKLIDRAKKHGFVMSNRRGKINSKLVARRYDKWIFLEPEQIVKRFRGIMISLINYYQGSSQRSDLYKLLLLYKKSCGLTLAHHHKFSSHKKAIAKYGKDLTITYQVKSGAEKTVDCAIPTLNGGGRFKTIVTESAFPQSINHAMELPGNLVPTTLHHLQNANELMCNIPNCPNKATSWHHVKHRKHSKINSSSKNVRVALFAKQIPVCELHHKLIQNGKYNGPSLTKMKGYSAEDWGQIT